MMVTHVRLLAERLMACEQSPHKLALTCALGVFIGISPLIGLHTVMTFVFAWLFSLNLATLFAISVLINNPWTMIPVYSIDHLFGTWLFNYLNIDYVQLEPVWLESCKLFLKEHTGITGLSLSAFLVGGNLLAVGISIIVYPFVKRMFTYYFSHKMLTAQQ
jgi:uncharacterized protein (DUF2062 family)